MKYIYMFLISFVAAGCKPKSDSKPIVSTPIAQTQSNLISASATNVSAEEQDKEQTLAAYEKAEDNARAQADKQYNEDQLELPDEQRDRTGYLDSKDIIIENKSGFSMRMDSTKIERNKKYTIARDIKFIEGSVIYGFDAGDTPYCKTSKFEVNKSNENWVEFKDVCLSNDANKSVYSWMLYDKNKHVLTTIYEIQGSNEFNRIRNKNPEVITYKNGTYSVYFPHLKDTMYFDISSLDAGCRWKSGEGEMDNSEKGCLPSNASDPIEIGVPVKANTNSSTTH